MEITLQKINKIYRPGLFKKHVHAVRDLSLEISEGEIFGLIGPNGAGKSTTIRVLLGLIRSDSGQALFRGNPLKDSNYLREIGYLPENPYLYDHLNLYELLTFAARVSGYDMNDSKNRINDLLLRVDMKHAEKRALRTFSKGMLQRAGLCFALLHDPQVVILDEPMSGLDPIGRKMVFDIVQDLKREGKTVFFCSHILSDVERLCDRIGLLHQGRLIRTYQRSDFGEEAGVSVHFLVGSVDEQRQRELHQAGIEVVRENHRYIVSVPGDRVAETAAVLSRLGIAIEGSRSERVSLENLFISAIQEESV